MPEGTPPDAAGKNGGSPGPGTAQSLKIVLNFTNIPFDKLALID